MIRAGAQSVDGWAKENGCTVLFSSGNLALREMYENLRDDPTAKLILVDRTRDKAKLPLFHPDLEAHCKPWARVTITLRDFLTERTSDPRWPLLVNTDRNIGRLILENLHQALQSHGQVRVDRTENLGLTLPAYILPPLSRLIRGDRTIRARP